MGIKLSPIINIRRKITFEELANKTISIDGYNILYQFLTTIRSFDGTPLLDQSGRITSHLIGLFYRTTNMLEKGIKPVYVFDGKPPELKAKEIEARIKRKAKAKAAYEEAKLTHDIKNMRKYSVQATSLTTQMVDDAKNLLTLMGIPWIQAPSEGEALAAYLAYRGICWGSVSQDYDSLLFGSPRLIRNLAITGKRRLPNREQSIEISPELIELRALLDDLGITREQLIELAILMGTDFNTGVEGIGPKKALNLIRKYGSIKAINGINLQFDDIPKIKSIFLDAPSITIEKDLKQRPFNQEGIIDFLCKERNFSPDRVRTALSKINKSSTKVGSLDSWLQ